jgi:hypothetical protein
MDRIIQGHLKTFINEQSIEFLNESDQFELFSSFCIVNNYYSSKYDIESTHIDVDDTGIDSICVLIDKEIATTSYEAKTLLSKPKKNIDVDIIFIQSKRSESFDRGEILKFGDGVYNFIQDESTLPQGEKLKEYKSIFDIIIENVAKITKGRPNAYLYYVTTGKYNSEPELYGTFENLRRRIKESGLFYEISVAPVDRDELLKLWLKSWESFESKIEVKGYTPYPKMEDVSQAYLCVISAKELIKKLLVDENGVFRTSIYEENVRHYLGSENPVNTLIADTLHNEKSKKRFCILNNGLTIISPDVRIQSDTISLKDYQIVNGCQTCHVLFENGDELSDDVLLTVKIIEVTNIDVISEIVAATNTQTKVEDTQFLSLRPIAKRIEAYFNAINAESSEEDHLYFERREKQYANKTIPEARIFDLKLIARCVGSMFLEKPDLASRYPNQMIDEFSGKIFDNSNKEIIYYTAALAYYRLHLLRSNARIPYNYSKYRWHMLTILKYIINDNTTNPSLNSGKISFYCQKIINVCKDYDRNHDVFQRLSKAIVDAGEVDRDSLKSEKYLNELKKSIFSDSKRNEV